jgi:hypothetical protein
MAGRCSRDDLWVTGFLADFVQHGCVTDDNGELPKDVAVSVECNMQWPPALMDPNCWLLLLLLLQGASSPGT